MDGWMMEGRKDGRMEGRKEGRKEGRMDERSVGHSHSPLLPLLGRAFADVGIWAVNSIFVFSIMILFSPWAPRRTIRRACHPPHWAEEQDLPTAAKRFWTKRSPKLHAAATLAHFENPLLRLIIHSFTHKYPSRVRYYSGNSAGNMTDTVTAFREQSIA